MATTSNSKHDIWDEDEDEDMHNTVGQAFPVYKQMGILQIGINNDDGPLVAMARMIQDDAESGGEYIVRIDNITITMGVEVAEQ